MTVEVRPVEERVIAVVSDVGESGGGAVRVKDGRRRSDGE